MFREIRELVNYHKKYGQHFAEHDCKNVFENAIKDLNSLGLEGLRSADYAD